MPKNIVNSKKQQITNTVYKLILLLIPLVNAVTFAQAQEKAPCRLLQSITQTSSLDSSFKRLDFSYDSNKRLTEEIVTSANSEHPDSRRYNYTLKINYEYSDDKLSMLLDGSEYSNYTLENGNIHLKELEYEDGRLKAISYSSPVFIQPLHDVVDKVFFYWDGDDVISISYSKGSQLVGSLKFEYREEKCNSPLMYSHILYWLPNPYNFWHETWVNHAALLHCGPLTPTRLIDSCRWSTGESQVFSYTFDNYGNPLTMSFDFPKNYYENCSVYEKFTWK